MPKNMGPPADLEHSMHGMSAHGCPQPGQTHWGHTALLLCPFRPLSWPLATTCSNRISEKTTVVMRVGVGEP